VALALVSNVVDPAEPCYGANLVADRDMLGPDSERRRSGRHFVDASGIELEVSDRRAREGYSLLLAPRELATTLHVA
jgi:hypothetical protein